VNVDGHAFFPHDGAQIRAQLIASGSLRPAGGARRYAHPEPVLRLDEVGRIAARIHLGDAAQLPASVLKRMRPWAAGDGDIRSHATARAAGAGHPGRSTAA
jgi:hypothetical protein